MWNHVHDFKIGRLLEYIFKSIKILEIIFLYFSSCYFASPSVSTIYVPLQKYSASELFIVLFF